MADKVVVIGGGITGLAAVHELVSSGHDDVVLLEQTDRFGGKIQASEFAGRMVDEGGDAFLARVPWAIEMCAELGLAEQLVAPTGRDAFIWADGSLHPLPTPNVLGIPLAESAAGELLSADAMEHLAADMGRSEPDPVRDDDTVGSLVRRRLGDEIFERVVNPLLGSINAGDMDELSVHASAPQIASAAAANPSLVNGLLAQRSESDPDAPVFYSLPGSLATMVDRLTSKYASHLRASASLEDISTRRNGLRANLAGGESVSADAIVLTTPAYVSGPAVHDWPDAASVFAEMKYVSVVLVTLAYRAEDVQVPVNGSGFLVPSGEPPLITACSWATSKWSHLHDGETAILRVSLGRSGADAVINARDADLISTVKLDLGQTMGITADPQSVRISRWPRSFPQYTVGHQQRVDLLRATLNPHRIFPAGAGLDGIGVPACIKSGRDAARAALGL